MTPRGHGEGRLLQKVGEEGRGEEAAEPSCARAGAASSKPGQPLPVPNYHPSETARAHTWGHLLSVLVLRSIFSARGWHFSLSRSKWTISVSSPGEWVYGKFAGSREPVRSELFFLSNASCHQLLLYLDNWQELTSLLREMSLEWPLLVIQSLGQQALISPGKG